MSLLTKLLYNRPRMLNLFGPLFLTSASIYVQVSSSLSNLLSSRSFNNLSLLYSYSFAFFFQKHFQYNAIATLR